MRTRPWLLLLLLRRLRRGVLLGGGRRPRLLLVDEQLADVGRAEAGAVDAAGSGGDLPERGVRPGVDDPVAAAQRPAVRRVQHLDGADARLPGLRGERRRRALPRIRV